MSLPCGWAQILAAMCAVGRDSTPAIGSNLPRSTLLGQSIGGGPGGSYRSAGFRGSMLGGGQTGVATNNNVPAGGAGGGSKPLYETY